VSDFVGNYCQHAKIQNDRPIWGVAAYVPNITIAYVFLVFLVL